MFLDETPGIAINHLQFSSVAIVPKNASWGTRKAVSEWEIEKSVLIIYDGGVYQRLAADGAARRR